MSPAAASSEDRISYLPNNIRCHILSFLPSSQISLTSLLSKRWKQVWITMPNADRLSRLPIKLLCRILSLLPFQQILLTTSLSKQWMEVHTRMTELNLDDTPYVNDEKALSCFYHKVLLFLLRLEKQHAPITFTFVSARPSGMPLMDILYRLHAVQHLNLTFLNYSFSTSFLHYDLYYDAFEFRYLTHLELSFEDNKYCLNWLMEFIRGCPVLQCLVIGKIRRGGNDKVVQNWLLDPQFIVPECFLSQLQMFSFRNYGGKESDFQFIKYIIQNARVLRNVTIYRNCCSSNPLEEENLQVMIKELQSCQRASYQLHFEWTMEH